ncbi:MAG TPA: deoxyribonuclease IV [Marmoricola sp.]|nr:deoxyribonuclease IV [Marmoricola sp.]
MPSSMTRPVGSHVFVGKGLVAGALRSGEEIGAEALQVFVGNPRGWALSPGDPAVDTEFAETCADRGVRTFVHTPYLVNLGSPTPATFERSVATIAHNLERAARIGAEGVVVHTGSCVEEGALDAALLQVREGLPPVLDALGDDGPWLLLEPTAGQGRSLCAGVPELGPYLDVLDRHPRVGVCLDTCHVFAAGAPLDEPGGATRTLDLLEEVAGAGRLRLVHANDSKDPRGSMRDRHERIGEGHIGEGAFAELFAHRATAGVPFVAETPGSGQIGSPCLPLLKKLRDQ